MAVGFIKTPLEIMELILYLLARADAPLELGQLTDLALCDDGVDYFQFTEALDQLVSTGHAEVTEDGGYLITQKGRVNGKATESELPYSVRVRCDRNIAELNRALQRARQVRSSCAPLPDGSGYTAHLVLDDEQGNVMTLDLMAPDRRQAERLCRRFHAAPEGLHQAVLGYLLTEED